MAQIDNFQKVKQYLLSKHEEIAKKLRDLDEEEFQLTQATPESSELGTYSWEADAQSTKAAIRRQLLNFAQNLQHTLLKLKEGTYGLCEKCKKEIGKERLEILPTASLCVSCLV